MVRHPSPRPLLQSVFLYNCSFQPFSISPLIGFIKKPRYAPIAPTVTLDSCLMSNVVFCQGRLGSITMRSNVNRLMSLAFAALLLVATGSAAETVLQPPEPAGNPLVVPPSAVFVWTTGHTVAAILLAAVITGLVIWAIARPRPPASPPRIDDTIIPYTTV